MVHCSEESRQEKMEKLRVEVGVKESVQNKLVRSRLKWTCGKMGDEKFAKRADAQKVEEKGGEEVWECDGRTALREIWKEYEKNVE